MESIQDDVDGASLVTGRYSQVGLYYVQFSPEYSQQTPHSLPWRARYGVFIVSKKFEMFPVLVSIINIPSNNLLYNQVPK